MCAVAQQGAIGHNVEGSFRLRVHVCGMRARRSVISPRTGALRCPHPYAARSSRTGIIDKQAVRKWRTCDISHNNNDELTFVVKCAKCVVLCECPRARPLKDTMPCDTTKWRKSTFVARNAPLVCSL